MAFNVRESYLQRHANLFDTPYEAIIQTTDDFETKTEGIFKSQDPSAYPS